ncbi:MAG: site-2 protease family protein [Bacilli bacterium]|nr:site-2 protease family protein [Bacilli bacterium]
MPVWVEWILYILIVLVMLGVLIAIHELGHLATAKMFKVYCFEYSIGMGPKLFSKKRKDGETYFSIRGIPFGGYVAMYGEPGAVPDGFEEPPAERSLQNIAKWKKCIVLVAGVTLNFVLGLVLIYIADSACPVFYSGNGGIRNTEGTYQSVTLDTTYDDAVLEYLSSRVPASAEYTAKDYVVELSCYDAPVFGSNQKQSVQILSSNVRMYATPDAASPVDDTVYVALYSPSTVISRHGLGDSIWVFPASKEEVPASLKALGVTHLPQIYDAEGNTQSYNFSNSADGVSIGLDLSFIPKVFSRDADKYAEHLIQTVSSDTRFRLSVKSGALSGAGVTVEVIQAWNSFEESWKAWAKDVPTACGAVVKGFASLFTPGGLQNLSGIIGITAAMPQINAAGGARMILFYAGMISINLAFFNLLPFPALDGWQLLVTVIEGITKKKVPQKVQGIVSTIGIILLFGLMIFIAIKDVISLIH